MTTISKITYTICSLLLVCYSCKSIHSIEQVPSDTYRIESQHILLSDPIAARTVSKNSIRAEVEQTDTMLIIQPVEGQSRPIVLKLASIDKLKFYRYTFDIDVLTVPFKVRPATAGFPEQLNANFDAAVYFGRRRDSYTIEKSRNGRSVKTSLTGVGYGYGGFVGIGSVTMNPFVTKQKIDYEYDGFVLNGGVAGIYDAKKFNLGIAIGTDFLVDKNRNNWIYQGKPWIGVLFGINLN